MEVGCRNPSLRDGGGEGIADRGAASSSALPPGVLVP